jgi:hypothetical protein
MSSRPVALVLAVLGTLLGACSATRQTTNTQRTWTEQLLVSSSVDRALDRVSWPSLADRAVFVESVSTAAKGDEAYLRSVAATHLALRGAAIVPQRDQAELVVTVLSGAIGTQETSTLIGVPETQSILFPVPFPEIAFYKSASQDAFAKAEVVVREAESGRIVFYERPKEGRASSTEHQVFLLNLNRTDAEDEQRSKDRSRSGDPAERDDDRLWWRPDEAARAEAQPTDAAR